jgi:ABC-2 type transport system ATP-binding protein
VAIIDHGQVIALGSPRELKERSGDQTRVEVRLTKPESPEKLKSLDGIDDCRELNGSYILQARRPPQAIVSLVKHLETAGNELLGLEISTPSLEDVFIELTGRRLRD